MAQGKTGQGLRMTQRFNPDSAFPGDWPLNDEYEGRKAETVRSWELNDPVDRRKHINGKTAPTEPPPVKIQATPYQWIDPAKITPRDWLYGRIYIRKFVTATVAPGATGKTSLLTVEAAPSHFLVRRISKARRVIGLWAEYRRDVQEMRQLCRENSARRKAKRLADTAAREVRSHDQPQNATAIGVDVPAHLQQLADEVIE
jgi:hypothetical protein